MTVVVVLSVSFLCFLQCYSGETASICPPDQPELFFACEPGKERCCPKLDSTIERSTRRYEPFNTIQTTIQQPQSNSDHDENIIRKTTSNYIDENGGFIKDGFKPYSDHIARERYFVNGQADVSENNFKHNFKPNISNNKVNGVPDGANKCGTNFYCIPGDECDLEFDDGEVLYPCSSDGKICCSRLKYRNSNDRTTQKYEPFNTVNPFINPNNFNNNDKPEIIQEDSSSADKISHYDNSITNKTIHGFNNHSSTNKRYHNENIIKSEKYNYDANVNTLTMSHKEQDPNSNMSNDKKSSDEQIFLPDKNNKTRSSSKFDSDNIIFNDTIDNKEGNNNFDKNVPLQMRKKGIFSKNCGITLAHDKITGGKIAELGQFPWMALLGFKHASSHSPQFLCGGSLITTRHILTAAHCIIENQQLELHSIRLGEYNLTTERDCVQYGKDKVCADHYVDVGVDQVSVHPNFNRRSLKNDIAIIRIKKDVEISDYISTICLPFDKDYTNVNMTGQNFTVSGWGKTSSGNLFGTNVIQYAKVTTWNPTKCNNALPSEVKPLSTTQLCANGANSEDSCKGDSGGPLINVTLDKDLEVRNIQFGVVSYGTGTCGDKNLPTIYTRVDQYLDWILKTVT